MNAKKHLQVTASAFTHSLADSFFTSKTVSAQDEALCQLLNCIADASAEIKEIFDYGYDIHEFERLVRARLGLASLEQICEVVAAIKKPIKDDESRRSKSSLIKSQAAGDKIKEDTIYFRVMMPALGLFHNLRERSRNIMTGRDSRSGRILTAQERRMIKSLRPLPEGQKAWAKLIVQLTLCGKYWSKSTALKKDGYIYKEIAESSVRNRRGKRIKAFKSRYAIFRHSRFRAVSPSEFLKLTNDEKMAVLDCSARGKRNPLSIVKATLASQRASQIANIRPTFGELERELTIQVKDRLKSVLRN